MHLHKVKITILNYILAKLFLFWCSLLGCFLLWFGSFFNRLLDILNGFFDSFLWLRRLLFGRNFLLRIRLFLESGFLLGSRFLFGASFFLGVAFLATGFLSFLTF